MALKFIFIVFCLVICYACSQKVADKPRGSTDNNSLTTTQKQLEKLSTTLSVAGKINTLNKNEVSPTVQTTDKRQQDEKDRVRYEKWKKRRQWQRNKAWKRGQRERQRKEREKRRERQRHDDDDDDDDEDDHNKPNVIYITSTIAAIFIVCFVALVTWHLKETDRLCFKQNENQRRNTNSSQRAFARRSKMNSSIAKPFPKPYPGEKFTNGVLSKNFINSVVIENISVSYSSPSNKEAQNETKLEEFQKQDSMLSTEKSTSDVLEKTVSDTLSETLTSLQIPANKSNSPSQHSLSHPGSSYLRHSDFIIGDVMNDVIVDIKQLYQQCEHSKDEICSTNKGAIESSDNAVNENSDLVNKNSIKSSVTRDSELSIKDFITENKCNDDLEEHINNGDLKIEIEVASNVDEKQTAVVITA
ncbi:uncharacterized protein [Clytia hemisphaerica]|uniref:Cnidarian restricted protein n=1 Tax=Clytia hemisphaerica TaxID=252671 RepID=A0A7M5XIB6_9CNID